MPIQGIGEDREPLVFVGCEVEVREHYQLLFMLPVGGELMGDASASENFLISSEGQEPICVQDRVLCSRPGADDGRVHFLNPTIEAAFLPVPSRLYSGQILLPCLISTEPTSFEFVVRRAIVSLAYRHFEFDPVYQCHCLSPRTIDILLPTTFPPPAYDAMKLKFEEGDRVPVWVDPARSDHRIIMQFETIPPPCSTVTVSLLMWELVELKPGMTLKRCKTWDQVSEMDGHLYRRSIEADFAVIEELL